MNISYKISEGYETSEHDKRQQFFNLKRSIKWHLITQKHKESVNNISIRTASDLKIENCEKTIGMRLARMAYLFKKR